MSSLVLQSFAQQSSASDLTAHQIGQSILHKHFPKRRLALENSLELGGLQEVGRTRRENFGGSAVNIFRKEGPVGQYFPAPAQTDQGGIAVFIQPPQADEAGLDGKDAFAIAALLEQRLAWAVAAQPPQGLKPVTVGFNRRAAVVPKIVRAILGNARVLKNSR